MKGDLQMNPQKQMTINFGDTTPDVIESIKALFQKMGYDVEIDTTASETKASINPIDIEREVTHQLLQLGIPAHIKGYMFLRSAIVLTIEDLSAIDAITKYLYPTIAKMYNTTSSRVERAMRHAIEVAWNRGNPEYLSEMFGYTIASHKDKPTNSEFIALIADKLRLNIKSA